MLNSQKDSLNLTPELLGLSDVKVTSVNAGNREVIIEVKSTRESIACRECGKPTHGHGLGRVLRLRHLPILGKETYIKITPRRGRCEDCDSGPTTTETMDWYEMNSKMTKAFEQHLLFELVNSTVTDVSQKENVDYHAVDALIERHIEATIDFSKIKKLGVIGIDEISLKKGYQDFVTLITYRVDEQVHILGVVKGREKVNIVLFLQTIPLQLHKTIRAVCCDLYEGYMNACQEVFGNKVVIVADRFHVRKLYRKSLVTLRKSELKRLKKELSIEKYADLKSAIALLRKQKDYFTEEDKPIVKKLFDLSPKLKLAYELSRDLSGIFDSHITPHVAKKKMKEWMASVADSDLNCFDHFIKTLLKYQIQITNYFISRNNSGFVEGFNNKVKVLKRRCYGLSNPTKLFKRLIVDTLGMQRFAPSVVAF